MGQSRRKRELGRGERVLPGVWRLRLPLPWPGVPHVNAFAVRSGDGIVLFDTGMATEDGQRQLELALAQVGFRLEDVSLVVCTHAHTDHYGLAAPIVDRAGCELWMHPAWEHIRGMIDDPDGVARPADRGRPAKRRPAEGAGALREVAPRRQHRDRPRGGAGPRARARGRGRDRSRRLAGDRDPRARAVARLPAPARERPGDLGRPPARPDLALLRLRPHARSGRRVHRRPRRGRPARAHDPLPRRPRAPVSRHPGEGRAATAPSSAGQLDRVPSGARRRARGRRSRSSATSSAPRTYNPAMAAWGLQLALAYLDHLALAGEEVEVEGSEPRRWRLA